jgi:hypothetical protein
MPRPASRLAQELLWELLDHIDNKVPSVEMIPGAANGTAACGVPGSGLGDAKRAVSFFQPLEPRDSCPGSADYDELCRYLPQQDDAEATDALHRVTPYMGIL